MTELIRHHHIQCGKHSGIPECCIEWFVSTWLPAYFVNHDFVQKYHSNNGDVGYIRCLNCIKDNLIVEIKECECKFPEEDTK